MERCRTRFRSVGKVQDRRRGEMNDLRSFKRQELEAELEVFRNLDGALSVVMLIFFRR